ncbi:transposase family protein [Methylobacterium sp. DB0501]|nr:transposase family protein [Methylobacterium sp. DB0501]
MECPYYEIRSIASRCRFRFRSGPTRTSSPALPTRCGSPIRPPSEIRLTHLLTHRGSCFTADAFEVACRRYEIEHRKTRPCTPKTNGMVERSKGWVQREVLGIAITATRIWSSCWRASA